MTYEEIVNAVKSSLEKKDFTKLADVALQIDITGEGEGAFYVAVMNKVLDVAPYEYYDRDAKLTISADELVAAIEGNSTAATFQIDGDVEKVSELLKLITTKAEAKKAAPKKAAAKKAEAPKAEKTVKVEKTEKVEKAEAPKKACAKKACAKKTTK